MKHRGPITILAVNTALIAGCSTAPLERAENLELTQAVAIPWTVHVEILGEEVFGGHEEWREELTRTFDNLRVCSAVVAGSPERADLRLTVLLKVADRPSPPKVDAQGALLDFLAWSTVPLLPLWIPDVNLDPGLAADVSLVRSGKGGLVFEDRDVRPPALKTTQLDRHHPVSWSMLGALFLPPFVFGSPDPERIQKTLAERVRLETACRIAGMVKRAPQNEAELMSRLEIKRSGSQYFLHYTPSDDLMEVYLRVEPIRLQEGMLLGRTFLVPPHHGTTRKSVPLKKLVAGEPAPGSLLRIEAVGRDPGQRCSYSIRIDPEEPTQGEEA
jgi:hypothetical protein